MANTLTELVPKLLAQGLMSLRNQVVMPRLVNSGYSAMAAEKGSAIDIPIPAAMAAVAVSPAITPPANTDTAITKIQLPLDQWWEVPFFLTDNEVMQVMDGTMSMQVGSAIKALAEKVNSQILSNYVSVFNYSGNAAAQAFASNYGAATAARKLLDQEAAPRSDRVIVVDPDGEESALNLASFTAADASGTDQGIMEGRIGRKLGFDWFMDQQVPAHTTGASLSDWLTAASAAVGASTVAIDNGSGASGASDPVAGDVFTVAGDTQTYVVTSHNPTGDVLSFYPKVRTTWADNAAITFKASHRVNLAFNRFAFAFASRPLAQSIERPGAVVSSVTDPVSGLSLRLEVTGQHKQNRYSFDMLWGSKCVRPELAARIGALP